MIMARKRALYVVYVYDIAIKICHTFSNHDLLAICKHHAIFFFPLIEKREYPGLLIMFDKIVVECVTL